MLNLKQMAAVGVGVVTLRRLLVAGAAATGLYTLGGDSLTYVTTAGRMVSTGVVDKIPVEFELERAKTMIGDLIPDIKRNMVVIAQEEVSVDNIREEIDDSQGALDRQREEIITLRDAIPGYDEEVRIGKRVATTAEIETELKRRFARYRMSEATLNAKRDLLVSRETSLTAARKKLERMLNSKRDLEVEVENLQARLHTVQSEAVTSKVEFDESEVARCEKLVDNLRVRLQVAERLLATDGSVDDILPSTFTFGDEDVVDQIDTYFAEKSSPGDLAKNVR